MMSATLENKQSNLYKSK